MGPIGAHNAISIVPIEIICPQNANNRQKRANRREAPLLAKISRRSVPYVFYSDHIFLIT